MAKGQVKKVLAQIQAENIVFALDIGTRSIIGMVGRVEEDKVMPYHCWRGRASRIPGLTDQAA